MSNFIVLVIETYSNLIVYVKNCLSSLNWINLRQITCMITKNLFSFLVIHIIEQIYEDETLTPFGGLTL